MLGRAEPRRPAPPVPHGKQATLENTATQAAFSTAATAIWGATSTGLTVADKAGMRSVIDAGLP